MCGGSKPPTQPTVDPAAERQKAADDAAKKANATLVNDKRRQRGQAGLLTAEQSGGTLLERVASGTTKRRKNALEAFAE